MDKTESDLTPSTPDFRLLKPYTKYLSETVSPIWEKVPMSEPGDPLFELGWIILSNKAFVEDIHISYLREMIKEGKHNPYFVELVSNFDKYADLVDQIRKKNIALVWNDERLSEDGVPENLFEGYRTQKKEQHHPKPNHLGALHRECIEILCDYETDPNLKEYIKEIDGISGFEELIALATMHESVKLDEERPFTDLVKQGLNKWPILQESVSAPLFCLLTKDKRSIVKEQNPKLLEIIERLFLQEFGPQNSSVYVISSSENPTGSLSKEYELDLKFLKEHEITEAQYIDFLNGLYENFKEAEEKHETCILEGIELRISRVFHYSERSPFTGEMEEQEAFDLVLYKEGKAVAEIPSCWRHFAENGLYESPEVEYSFSPRKILPLFGT